MEQPAATAWKAKLLLCMSVLATASVLVAIALSLILLSAHYRHNKNHHLRRITMRMLFMVPLFASDAWTCLFLERTHFNAAFLISVVRDFYEAAVLVSFVQFLLISLGPGDDQSLSHTMALAEKLLSHTPSHCQLYKWFHWCPLPPWLWQPGPGFLLGSLVGVLQYALAMVIFVLLRILAYSQDVASTLGHKLSLRADGVKTFSCGIAMYHLVLLGCNLLECESTKRDCHRIHMEVKFLCVKGIIIFVQFQHFLIMALIHFQKLVHFPGENADQTGDTIVNFLLCIEILFFAFCHFEAYPAHEFNAQASKLALKKAWQSGNQSKLERAIKMAEDSAMATEVCIDYTEIDMACTSHQIAMGRFARVRSGSSEQGFESERTKTPGASALAATPITLQLLDGAEKMNALDPLTIVMEDKWLVKARKRLQAIRDGCVDDNPVATWMQTIKFLGFLDTMRNIVELYRWMRKCREATASYMEHRNKHGHRLDTQAIFDIFDLTQTQTLNKFEFHLLWTNCKEEGEIVQYSQVDQIFCRLATHPVGRSPSDMVTCSMPGIDHDSDGAVGAYTWVVQFEDFDRWWPHRHFSMLPPSSLESSFLNHHRSRLHKKQHSDSKKSSKSLPDDIPCSQTQQNLQQASIARRHTIGSQTHCQEVATSSMPLLSHDALADPVLPHSCMDSSAAQRDGIPIMDDLGHQRALSSYLVSAQRLLDLQDQAFHELEEQNDRLREEIRHLRETQIRNAAPPF